MRLKQKEVKFYKSYRAEGITNDAVRNSLNKFCICFDKYESALFSQKNLTGDNLSLVDLAWFIYTYRLYVSGFPFKAMYPKISKWFHGLYSQNEFYKEVNDPILLKVIRFFARMTTNFNGKSIKSLLSA